MDDKRSDLRKLADEGLIDIDPMLVDDLTDDTVHKLLGDYKNKLEQDQQTAAILTTLGVMTESVGVRGTAKLATDVSNNPHILKVVSDLT